jgi:muconate cycloisomerase
MQERAGGQTMQGVQPPLIIRRVDAVPVALPLTKPMKMAGVTITHAENVLVRIESAGGLVGWGEAASAPTMTGDTLGGLLVAVRDYLAPLVIGQDAWGRPALIAALRRALIGNTGAHSAVEMALLDLAGRAAGLPLIELVGGAKRHAVAPMWLLGNATPEQDIDEARAKQREGFDFFKLKIGTKKLNEEIAGTLSLRAALGPHVPLCADANGGLLLQNACAYVQHTRAAGLLFLEQPLDAHDLDGLAELTRVSPIPIGADESIHSVADIAAQAQCGVRGLSLKLIKLGGISMALEAAALSARLGLSLNIAAKIAESSIATAATVHLACAAPSADWGVSLTHFYLADDLVRQPLPLRDGGVALPAGPGLGVDVDEAAVERMRVNR